MTLGKNHLLDEANKRLGREANRLDWIVVGLCAVVILIMEVWA